MSFFKNIFAKNTENSSLQKVQGEASGIRPTISSMNEIIDNFLYLGSLPLDSDDERSIEKKASMRERQYKIPVESMMVEIEDSNDANIMVHFDKVADKIDRVMKHKGKVLVHCISGVNRSSTLVIAYLMKYHNMTLKNAYSLVKQKRPMIGPKPGFWSQLVDYEMQLFGRNTETKDQLVWSVQ
ncbi:dual specificity protein phosphatase 14 isoform X2 [Exaiptasia diaphana]|uniref:Protein-tyrosine-phosphatase n=1 Tax=Exaiptasia diaphana TaxID=2652724 RepID=A0A913XGY0_EXADI|nr:dual specificity protein phosphatase 14 isoform X2 [Exaiptasia diaphana]